MLKGTQAAEQLSCFLTDNFIPNLRLFLVHFFFFLFHSALSTNEVVDEASLHV